MIHFFTAENPAGESVDGMAGIVRGRVAVSCRLSNGDGCMLLHVLMIIAGFILLLKGADFFVDGAAALAARFGIPQIVIGLTIVAFGTSAPEAAVSINAAIHHNNGISIGNVVGSNIMNIMLILGITGVISLMRVKKSTIRIDMPVMVVSTFLMAGIGYFGKTINRPAGILFLVLLVSYLLYLGYYSKKNGADTDVEIKEIKGFLLPVFILGGLAAIIIGSRLTVNGASYVAREFGLSDRLIGLTIVAFGTSLPELMTSVTAARKHNADIAIGNIVGSNIFNILFILGMTATILPLPFISEAADFTIDAGVAILAAMLLWVASWDGKVGRRLGVILLSCYVVYFGYLVVNK